MRKVRYGLTATARRTFGVLFVICWVPRLYSAEAEAPAPVQIFDPDSEIWRLHETPAVESKSVDSTAETTPAPPKEVSEKQEQAREREQTAEEDPLAKRQADKTDRPEEAALEPDEFKPYISLRARYRVQGDETVWTDGDTRAGLEGRWQYRPNHWFGGRAEIGLNVLDEAEVLFNPRGRTSKTLESDTVFLRLFYVGIDTPRAFATVGKNWSTYYQVSSFTDKFQGAGGSASGTYNAGTDGGPTGTGRSDRVLQTRSNFKITPKILPAKPFRINAQFQYGEPIPAVDSATYGLTVGLSAIYELVNDLELGLAYNHANVQRLNDPVVKAAGLEGDAQALVLGARWFNDKWYVATVVSRLLNHETTDEFIYFDGTGWELYTQYRFHGPWYVVGGWNYLEPDSGQPRAGDFEIKYGVLGVRYTFDKFRRMVYFNVRLEDGRTADGETEGDIYTVGVRWDFP